MIEKLEHCPECGEELRQHGYDFQFCWTCGWGVKERGPYAADIIKEIKPRFQYIRDAQNRPVIIICILETPHGTGYGMAICSPPINSSYRGWQKISRQRAQYAIEKRKNWLEIRRDKPYAVIDSTIKQLMSMPGYDPALLDYKIVYKKRGESGNEEVS